MESNQSLSSTDYLILVSILRYFLLIPTSLYTTYLCSVLVCLHISALLLMISYLFSSPFLISFLFCSNFPTPPFIVNKIFPIIFSPNLSSNLIENLLKVTYDDFTSHFAIRETLGGHSGFQDFHLHLSIIYAEEDDNV